MFPSSKKHLRRPPNNNNNRSSNLTIKNISQLPSPLLHEFTSEPDLPTAMYMPCISSCTICPMPQSNPNYKQNTIYILGSQNNQNCWLYDLSYQSYIKLSNFPNKIIPNAHCISKLCNPSAKYNTTIDDNIIVSIGGSSSGINKNTGRHLFLFNVKSNEWIHPSVHAHQHNKDIGVGSRCLLIFNRKNNTSEIHCAGGNRKANYYMIYNLQSQQWREGPKLPIKIMFHGMIHIGPIYNSSSGKQWNHTNQIIIFGGCSLKKGWIAEKLTSKKMYRLILNIDDEQNIRYNDTLETEEEKHFFHVPKNETCHSLGWEYLSEMPIALQNFAYICVLNNFILIFGGDIGNNVCSDRIYSYNIKSDEWKLLSIRLPQALFGISICETDDCIIHLFGGHCGKFPSSKHWSIATSQLLRKEFDQMNLKCVWKDLSIYNSSSIQKQRSLSMISGDTYEQHSHMNEQLYGLIMKCEISQKQILSYKLALNELQSENQKLGKKNISLLSKLANALQDKEELLYQMENRKQLKSLPTHEPSSIPNTVIKDGEIISISNSPKGNTHQSMIAKKMKNKVSNQMNNCSVNENICQTSNEHQNENAIETLIGKKGIEDGQNANPRYTLFKNFLFGRVCLPQYLNHFHISKYCDICKVQLLNEQILKFTIGIENELHRKLFVRIINEFKLEILQFRSWLTSYNSAPMNLKKFEKNIFDRGSITWHLISQSIECKIDLKVKYNINDNHCLEFLYENILNYLNGNMPLPNNKRIKKRYLLKSKSESISKENAPIDSDFLLSLKYDGQYFDDSEYHHW